MSRLMKVSIDSVLYDIGSKGINSYATLSELVNEKVSELYDGCIAWCSEDSKYYQWLSINEIISIYGRWRELEFGSEFQVDDPTVDASTEKYKGKIIQYVGVDDVASGFKRGCFYESRLSNVINYVVATVDASTVGTYYTLDDEGVYNPITLVGDGTGYDPSTVYYKKQDVEVYAWAYINSLKVETDFDENSDNAVANKLITAKFNEIEEYIDGELTDNLKQYADEKINDVDEVSEDKAWSNSKTKDYVDTTVEGYEKKFVELTFEEYKALDEAGEVEPDVDYVITSDDESGILLASSDIAYDNSASGLEATNVQGAIDKVVETVENTELAIEKHSLPLIYDSGVRGNSSVEVYKLSNALKMAEGGNDPNNLNLLLSTRGGDEVEIAGGKNDSGWFVQAKRNLNSIAPKISVLYKDGLDLYIRLELYFNFLRIYHKSGVLPDNFAVERVSSIPSTATEITINSSSIITTKSLTLNSGYSGYITEQYDPTTKVVVYNVNVSGSFKGLMNSIANGFKIPKGSTSSSDVMHHTIGIYGSSTAMTGDAQFTRLLVRNYGNPHLEADVNNENITVSGTITYVAQ